jgi:hypothetical protein
VAITSYLALKLGFRDWEADMTGKFSTPLLSHREARPLLYLENTHNGVRPMVNHDVE